MKKTDIEIISDEGIHAGHRERMRNKLRANGARTFESYELLEMILYDVIPIRNTNPTAKKLINAFGGFKGLFSASKEDIMLVPGVGERTAAYIESIGGLYRVFESSKLMSVKRYDTFEAVGKLMASLFKEERGNAVYVSAFTNGLGLIKSEKLYDADYGSAVIKGKKFVSFALGNSAAAVSIAFNHPHGPLYPTESDRATNAHLVDTLSGIGIEVLEIYVVCGDSYRGTYRNISGSEKNIIFKFGSGGISNESE